MTPDLPRLSASLTFTKTEVKGKLYSLIKASGFVTTTDSKVSKSTTNLCKVNKQMQKFLHDSYEAIAPSIIHRNLTFNNTHDVECVIF